MALTKPNQELRRDLKAAAFSLEDAALDLGRLAKRCTEAEFLTVMQKVGALYEQVDRLRAYADEVKSSRIVRAKADE